ncbi:zinc ABC transporter substrate-binding protein [Pacificibacter sp.]|uniref:zinc ABC transporter substrate-binding protein n=1 Tax=Pacificibacter sp. TaxID=1917866 RepID=UPI00321A1B66
MTRTRAVCSALLLSTAPVMADVPTVATDIAPVHSLAAQVMAGVGAPTVLMKQDASPHDYALRPSDAKNLQDADVVFWIGDGLTPWLGDAITTLSPDALSVSFLESAVTQQIEFREGLTFEDHDHDEHAHDDEHEDHDDHAHEDEHEHEHEGDHAEGHEHEGHDDHDEHEGHDDHEGHDHSGVDPHAWLDPENAIAWLGLIAQTLSELDPANANTYAANAARSAANLATLTGDLKDQLSDDQGAKFVVFHDAYHYFEARFGLSAMGAISLGDAAAPSPARISKLQDMIKDKGVDCVLSEPQFNAGLVRTLLAGTPAHSGVIDPLGQGLEMGADFYGKLIQGVADSFDACR